MLQDEQKTKGVLNYHFQIAFFFSIQKWREKKGVEIHVYWVFVVKRKSSEWKEKVFGLNLHSYSIKSNVNSQYCYL